MTRYIKYTIVWTLCVGAWIACVFLGPGAAYAQNIPDIPGPADAGRIEAQPEQILPPREAPKIIVPELAAPEAPVPEGAASMTFVLQNVVIEGMSAFSPVEMEDIYKPLLGREIELSRVWEFAGRITERYQQAGYFLSRTYVPAQEIGDGRVILRVIEGYVGDVQIEGAQDDNYLVDMLGDRITGQKPARLQDLERALLLLGDIPGRSFEAVLGRMDDGAPEGAVRLILKESKTNGRGSLLLNNHGSRFTGPHRTSFAYEDSFLPNQSTAVSGIASALPVGDELWAVNATHEIKILPEVGLELSLGRTVSQPGYTLASNDIESRSVNWGVGLNWQVIRQRQHNMSFSLALDGRNVNTDILDTPLTRDRIRAVRLSGSYDGADPLHGYNALNMTLSRGITGLGANEPGELNLSRADAEPDFTKFEATWQRSQFIAADWLGVTTLTGQRASKALYSSEEFGFGGPSLGRAYDASEITGDHGIGGAVEVQYTGIEPVKEIKFTPSVFYEAGKIWNIDDGQDDGLSIADAGIGLNISHPSGLSGALTIAQPLTKSIDTPTYGNNGHNPRIYFQLGWTF
ncbi:MAG: ShlB/FhaC/HecB family hemolysin secretion/activation protein [Rhodospirillales bacterium]|nr:ShlB/FhaC/HecB family hemolysin secretion/activation protein [Rhodospirillales bacterium]